MIIDEATESVGVSAEAEIQRAIDGLARDKTVVVIAYRLRTLRRANRIVALDRGRVAEAGAQDELMARDGLNAALWREQERASGWLLESADAKPGIY